MKHLSDIDLWKSIKKGDIEAFKYVYNRYYKDLYYYGLKLSNEVNTTKDCIHDLFIQIWSKKATVNEIKSIKSYLMTCFRRRLIKMLNEGNKLDAFEYRQLVDHQTQSAEDAIIIDESMQEMKAELTTAIDNLTRRQREVIHLKYFMNLDYDEICEIMDLKYQTVRNLICESMKALRNTKDQAIRMTIKSYK